VIYLAFLGASVEGVVLVELRAILLDKDCGQLLTGEDESKEL